jgi:hypothetical protein
MKKNIPTPLAEEYLNSVQQIKEAETDPFFYTRLKARMEKQHSSSGWNFPLKPVWLVSMLILFLFVNTVFLVTQVKQTKETAGQSTSLQNFASGYDLSVSTSF